MNKNTAFYKGVLIRISYEKYTVYVKTWDNSGRERNFILRSFRDFEWILQSALMGEIVT